MTSDEADILIAYCEVMEERTNHQANLEALKEMGYSGDDLNRAAIALGKIAGRDYRME